MTPEGRPAAFFLKLGACLQGGWHRCGKVRIFDRGRRAAYGGSQEGIMNDPLSFSEHLLPCGMKLLYQPRNLRWFGASLLVGCGQRHDPPGKEELAHLLEH